MENNTRPRLHPVLWIAAISIILFSLIGVGAMTGLIPSPKASESSAPSAAVPVTTAVERPQAISASPPVQAKSEPSLPDAAVKPAPVRRSVPPQHHRETATIVARAPDPPPPFGAVPPDAQPPVPEVCKDCGVVESVRSVAHEGDGSGLGAVAGGVLGGVLGNGVGQGNGRKLVTVAGIVGGALLGNRIEKNQRTTTSYEMTVSFEDGSRRVFPSATEPGWRTGDRVKVDGAVITAR